MSIFDLSDQVAVVIGGTGALGGAMAQALGEHRAKVAILGRNEQRGEQRVAAIGDAGGEAAFHVVDAMDRESLLSARDAIVDTWGPVTVLVNAAGGNRPDATLAPGDAFEEMPLEGLKGVFDLNLIGGMFLPVQAFAATMLEQNQGSIINIASMSGMTPLSRVVGYSAAKAAVLNMTQFLAREWASRGVRVNAISPGFFPAEQNKALLFQEDGSYTRRGHQIISHTPMDRFGDPQELSGAVVWLASPRASSFVTGQNIVIDGGFSCMTI